MEFIALEGVPIEIKREMDLLAEKDKLFEGTTNIQVHFTASLFSKETRRGLFKKRCLLMKAEEKGLDASMQATLLRKAEKDFSRSVQLVDEKIAIEERLVELVKLYGYQAFSW